MWHVETDYFALLLFVVMLYKNRALKKERDFRNKVFYYLLLASIINVIVDIVSSTAMNDVKSWWFYQLTMTIYILTMPLLAAAWLCYTAVLIDKDKTKNEMYREIALIMAPYAVYALLGLSNPITGLFFHLTADMEYSRGVLFLPLGVGFVILYSFAGVLLVLGKRKKIQPQINVALFLLFFGTTMLSIFVQLANPGWLIINACYAVVYVLCDMTIEEQSRKRLVDEIKEQNSKLEIAVQKAEAATKSKTIFLSNMSHDMRTPMNGILGLTALSADETDVTVLKENLRKIDESGKYLLEIINDTLDLQRIESGKLTLNLGVVDCRGTIENALDMVGPAIAKKKIDFQVVNKGVVMDCMVRIDQVRMKQIFVNLISNAIKFTPEGGKIFFEFECLGRDGMIAHDRFTVRDTGVGMSADFIKNKLFTSYAQEQNVFSNQYAGTGLGLFIVKRLVDMMGGTIEVVSKLGEGTAFVICLDIERVDGAAEKQSAAEASERQRSKIESLNGCKILLAEDQALNAEIARKLLEKIGCEVSWVQDGQACLDAMKQFTPGQYDVILMDLRMPVMDGLTATAEIRKLADEDARSIPIIAMTANAYSDDIAQCLAAGMNAHIAKPINPTTLYETIGSHLKTADMTEAQPNS